MTERFPGEQKKENKIKTTMDHLDDPTEEFLKSSRFWIQRVFVPILVLIGVIGNVVTVMVLTRKRMRCTTTIYLTALAVADILYLFFVLLLSFEHYPNINDIKYELYWRFSGINHWLCDAASSTSVWLTVSFTIERYIVVCHPIRGKILCTENRAKSIIAIIGILCLMTTASTVFEYQLNTEGNCSSRHSNNNNRFGNNDYIGGGGGGGVSDGDKTNESDKSDISNDGVKVKSDDVCTIRTEATNLGKNDTYTSTMNWYAAIFFGLLPVILIATFNCFLISAVYRSQKERKLMTNLHDHVKMYQENRITLLLIGIVVLFLVCQTPTATFLIYDALDTASYDNRHIENVKKICGNVFNLLLSINAACNFLLYCVLSDRYRRTFKALFCCNRNGNNNNGGTLYEITRGRITQRLASHRAFNKIKRNNTTTAATTATTMTTRTPRNLEAHSLTSIPRSKSLMVRQLGRAKSSDMNV